MDTLKFLNLTDFIVMAIILVFFIDGYTKGLLRNIFGLIAFGGGILAGYSYFQTSGKLFVALMVSMAATIILNLIFYFFRVLFTKKKDEEKSIFSFTQFLAGLINASWKGGLFLVVLFLIVNVQLKLPYLSRIQNNIIESYTYATIYKVAGNKIPVISMDTENIKTIVEDPQKFQQLQSTESYKKLMDNQKIKDLYSDEDITRLAAEKNFVELIKNPKVQNLMQDKEILKDVFLLMKDIHNISKENQQ